MQSMTRATGNAEQADTLEPSLIKTDEQYRRALEAVERLAAEDPPADSPAGARLELWAKLVEDYEKTRYPFAQPDPVEAQVELPKARQSAEQVSSELARIFDAEDLADDPGGRFNVAPTDEAAVIVQREDRRAVVRYRWGLVPSWASDPKAVARSGQTTVDMANGPVQRIQPYPETIALLESLGAVNNHRCVSC